MEKKLGEKRAWKIKQYLFKTLTFRLVTGAVMRSQAYLTIFFNYVSNYFIKKILIEAPDSFRNKTPWKFRSNSNFLFWFWFIAFFEQKHANYYSRWLLSFYFLVQFDCEHVFSFFFETKKFTFSNAQQQRRKKLKRTIWRKKIWKISMFRWVHVKYEWSITFNMYRNIYGYVIFFAFFTSTFRESFVTLFIYCIFFRCILFVWFSTTVRFLHSSLSVQRESLSQSSSSI